MKAVLYCLFVASSCGSVLSQSMPEWRKGVVVLFNDDVLTGEISTYLQHDLILFRSNGNVQVLQARKVQLFRYYDEDADINRQFVCLQEDQQQKFFEVVVQGPVKVLRRARSHSSSASDEIDGYHYFSWDGAALEPLQKFRSRVYPKLVADLPLEIETFVAQGHLKLHEMKSAILIIKEYNRIQKLVIAKI